MNETVVYHEVTAYPMKCRLYLTQKQKASVDEWLLGLGKAYNMTMYALKTGDHRIMQEGKPDENGNTAWFPDFHKMAGKQWLDELRSQNEHVKHVPSVPLRHETGMGKTGEAPCRELVRPERQERTFRHSMVQ